MLTSLVLALKGEDVEGCIEWHVDLIFVKDEPLSGRYKVRHPDRMGIVRAADAARIPVGSYQDNAVGAEHSGDSSRVSRHGRRGSRLQGLRPTTRTCPYQDVEGSIERHARSVFVKDRPLSDGGIVPHPNWMGIRCATRGEERIEALRDEQLRCGLTIGEGVIDRGEISNDVSGGSRLDEDRAARPGEDQHIEGCFERHGRSVFIKDLPFAKEGIVHYPDRMGIVRATYRARIEVRGHKENGVRKVISRETVDDGQVTTRESRGGYPREVCWTDRPGRCNLG